MTVNDLTPGPDPLMGGPVPPAIVALCRAAADHLQAVRASAGGDGLYRGEWDAAFADLAAAIGAARAAGHRGALDAVHADWSRRFGAILWAAKGKATEAEKAMAEPPTAEHFERIAREASKQGKATAMWMTEYIAAIKRGLRDHHGFTPTGGTERDPTFTNVPDGEYPMTIDGKLDRVRIVNGRFKCCNFEPAPADPPGPPDPDDGGDELLAEMAKAWEPGDGDGTEGRP